jgi:hypothetical protein
MNASTLTGVKPSAAFGIAFEIASELDHGKVG